MGGVTQEACPTPTRPAAALFGAGVLETLGVGYVCYSGPEGWLSGPQSHRVCVQPSGPPAPVCLLSLVLGVASFWPNFTLMLAVPTASTLFRLDFWHDSQMTISTFTRAPCPSASAAIIGHLNLGSWWMETTFSSRDVAIREKSFAS